ncbi:protein-disulfide reductase DsbD family protein [Jejudonia soesokkakensis]|uniref:Protein-disulfide reductase DsbD family protein n=1 Tax=Jejudonia soesokkakensis TaxID=1323432 RepID=A0ABW2MUD9_9FLAO
MKKLLLIVLVLTTVVSTVAQDFSALGNQQGGDIKDPVDWEAKVNAIDANNFEFKLNAFIDDEWHIYSQTTPNEGIGPIPLALTYINAEGNFETTSELTESKTYREFSEVWGFDEVFFKETATLSQKIKLLNPAINVIKAELTYQVCKTVCLNEERYVVFDLAANKALFIENYDDFEAYASTSASLQKDPKKVSEVDNSEVEEDNKKSDKKGLWTIFFIAFLSGFAALLTPCVFPMIPLTVSFFTKQSKTRSKGIKNAILYAFFIVVIYVLLGTVVTAIFGADALNALSTNVWFNIIFFVLLVIFAISFLGAFEITLPQSWANRVDKNADRGGIAGIFFMALALAIVSFSCTGPIVGTLLVEAASKGGTAPIIGMLGFSLAIALPFALFAMFPGWLNSLPKSGGWLNSVKVFLGFLELALAFKFLSNADLVLQLHWFEREIFLAIWIAIFGALALYLLGKLKLPHDSPSPNISVGRLLLGLVTLSFTIYLVPGLWGAPLKLISGFPPPMNYSEAPYGVGYTKVSSGGTITTETEFPKGAELGPHDILAFTDYFEGLAYAKEIGKPVLLDFTGYACVNCRKMEERVWAEPSILNMLKNDVVLISLYGDDKRALPKEEQYTSETTGKRVNTIGRKWSDFFIKRYNINAQPYYILMDHEENTLNPPVGYTPDVEEYEAWLTEGISNFSEK